MNNNSLVNIKKATLQDSNFFLMLRNKNRKNFTNTKSINQTSHFAWFKKNYKKNFYVIFFKNKKAGYLRAPKIGLFYEISICVDRKFRRKNLGKLAFQKFEKKFSQAVLLIAKVKPNNKISANFFKNLSFHQISKSKIMFVFCKIVTSSQEIKKSIDLIDKIQKIRSKNNINWMNILKLSFNRDINAAKSIFKDIVNDDNLISKYSKQLGG